MSKPVWPAFRLAVTQQTSPELQDVGLLHRSSPRPAAQMAPRSMHPASLSSAGRQHFCVAPHAMLPQRIVAVLEPASAALGCASFVSPPPGVLSAPNAPHAVTDAYPPALARTINASRENLIMLRFA
jgi:hypothetical protein